MAASIERRQREEAERKQRIFNAKFRSIGIDKSALDSQIAEKELIKQNEAARQREFDEQSLFFSTFLKQQEIERQRQHHLLEKQDKEFNLTFLRAEQRKDFDLSDPLRLKKDVPARIGDDDPRCGPSSLQKFDGEDLTAAERVALQQAQMAEWVRQKISEKEYMKQEERDELMAYVQQQEMFTEIRRQMEQEQAQRNRDAQVATRDANLYLAEERRLRDAQDRRVEDRSAQEDVMHQTTSAFLNEDPAKANSTFGPHRVVKYEWKGMNRDQMQEILNTQEAQKRERALIQEQERQREREYELQSEACRRLLIASQREMERKRNQLRANVRDYQKSQDQEFKARYAHLNQVVYTNPPAEEYFTQWGTSSR
eukprot:GILK01000584.1.p1 GENE.GILK01000584.1~~GILK01000584.1.p1  ORF type:complete len:402 (-),score=99.54 GILK01000584.1:127-1233(-)